MTPKLQILDVGVNKPFKNYYERQKDALNENARLRKTSRNLQLSILLEK